MPTEKSPGEAKRKTLSLFSSIASLFILTQALGLYSGTFIIDDARGNEIVSALGLVSAQPGSGLESAFYMLVYVLLGALVMFLVLRFYKGDLLIRLIEFAVISVSSSIVFYSLLKPLLHVTMLSAGLAIILALAFAAAKMLYPGLRNIAAVVATAGAGAVFGFSLGFLPALAFLVLLSIYDYIAVFKTKHMVEMADAVSKKQIAFVISSREKTEHGEIGFELGTGDMLMPIVLAVSASRINQALSLVLVFASLVSLLALFLILSRKKAVIPALPVIAFFSILFTAIAFLLGLA